MNHHDLITAPLTNSSQVPPRGRPIKFTPERIQQIGNLVERGKSREEIAELIEVTVGSLQVTCSKLGISLRRSRLDNGIRLLPRGKPVRSNGRSTSDPSCDVSMPLQPIGEGSWQDSQPGPPERTGHTTRHQQRPKTKEADLANLTLEDDDEYDTVGGLVYHRVGGVPSPGDEVNVDGLRLTVESTDGRRVGKVLVVRQRPEDGGSTTDDEDR